MKKQDPEQSYEGILERLETLLQELESEDVPVGKLAAKVKEAGVLMNQCRARLKATEGEVQTLLESFD